MRLPQLPTSMRWDHNAHYHRFLRRQLPAAPERALDAGCGAGDFAARLAERSRAVDAVDVSPVMIAAARAAHPDPRIRWIEGDVLALDLEAGGYDAVVSIAALHHLPLDVGLRRLGALVAPGGTLAVLGLARAATPADYARAALAAAPTAAIGLVRGARGPHPAMPVRDPRETLAEVRAAAARELPGARVRRHLFWRFSLVWRRASGPSPRRR